MANWIQRFLGAITTHKADASAHHAKYTDTEAQTTVKANVEVGDLKAPTKALAMNSQKITGLAAPAVANDAVRADANLRAPDSSKLEGSSKATVQDHTPKAHTLASHSTKAHSELTGVTSNQHHAQSHTLDSHSAGRIGKDRFQWTANKLLKGTGVGSDPTEIDVPSAGVGLESTPTLFQANAGTGTMSSPSALNDNNTTSTGYADAINEYTEFNFGKVVCIKRWRMYGDSLNDQDGIANLQYYDLNTHSWVTWKSNIADRLGSWSEYETLTEVLTDKVRFTVTTLPTDGYYRVSELEVIY